jgi:hypothetical protein
MPIRRGRQRADGDHQTDIERGVEEQQRARKAYACGQRRIAQLRDEEQVDEIDDE